MTIRLRLGDAPGAKRPRDTGDILDHHLLPERARHMLGNNRPTISVGPPAAKGTIIVM